MDKLMDDLKDVIANAEALLQFSATEGAEQAQDLRIQMQDLMRQAKKELSSLQDAAAAKVKETADATNAYVQENPWKTAGIAAGLGLVLGLLIRRR